MDGEGEATRKPGQDSFSSLLLLPFTFPPLKKKKIRSQGEEQAVDLNV